MIVLTVECTKCKRAKRNELSAAEWSALGDSSVNSLLSGKTCSKCGGRLRAVIKAEDSADVAAIGVRGRILYGESPPE